MNRSKDQLIATHASLIKRLSDWQDAQSWQEFFDTYWKLIYGVAHKAGLSDAEAQDVVQETMVSVAKHMPRFHYDPAIGSFKAWLLTMSRWRIIAQFRKRMPASNDPGEFETNEPVPPIEAVPDPAGDAIAAAWEAEWENNLLEAAIMRIKRRIDPQTYQIFDFHVNKGWPPEKVAQRFNVAVDNVYLIKHRVTERIRQEVKRLETEIT